MIPTAMFSLGSIVDGVIYFQRLFPASDVRVWEYLTKPDLLATWLAAAEFEARVGGRVELRFNVEEVEDRRRAGAVITGVVRDCEPPRFLTYNWTDAAAPDSEVVIELEGRREATLLALTHSGLPETIIRNCGAGWHAYLDILAARLRGEAPVAFQVSYGRVLASYVT